MPRSGVLEVVGDSASCVGDFSSVAYTVTSINIAPLGTIFVNYDFS